MGPEEVHSIVFVLPLCQISSPSGAVTVMEALAEAMMVAMPGKTNKNASTTTAII
jgi:hypothetical protein